MHPLAKGLTQHSIVLCFEKKERAIALQSLLMKAGFKVTVAVSLYEALKYIEQEMPHLVFTESVLSDGKAINLHDRLQPNPMLSRIPILVHIINKTREEVTAIAQRKFAGYLLGKVEIEQILAKIGQTLTGHAMVSPYYLETESTGIDDDITLYIDATVMGRQKGNLVVRSSIEVDPAASLMCVPKSNDFEPAMFRYAANLKEEEGIINLFPVSRILGKGRKWIMNIPDLDKGPAKAKQKARRVLYYDPVEKRYLGFRDILKGYDIELIYAATLSEAATIVVSEPESIGCVYLNELLSDASGLQWKSKYTKLPATVRPPLIVGTSAMGARSTSAVRYIKKPFGLGVFVETLESSFERASHLSESMQDNVAHFPGVNVFYEMPAKLLGLDEVGGLLQIRFPMLRGNKVYIKHPFLEKVWEGRKPVEIAAASPLADRAGVWQIRFAAVDVGMSKTKYWERISAQLKTQEQAATG